MIYNICVMQTFEEPILSLPVHQPFPMGVEVLGQAEGIGAKEAYINWLVEQADQRFCIRKDRKEFVEDYRKTIELDLASKTDRDYGYQEGDCVKP